MFAAIELRTGAWRREDKAVTQSPVKAPGWRLRTQIHGRPVSKYESSIDLGTIDILRYQSEARMLAPSRFQHEAEEGAVLLDRYHDPCPNSKPLSQEDKFISLLSIAVRYLTCRGGVISPDRLRPREYNSRTPHGMAVYGSAIRVSSWIINR